MGWKPGQGVGPRLSGQEKSTLKKLQKPKKIYGCALPGQENEPAEEVKEDSEEDAEFLANVTFAPDDFEPYIVKPKNDCFGLGYSGLDRRPVLSSHINLFAPQGSSLVMQEKKKKISIRGQAFGVGALEEDDEDIYTKEDMSQYDFALDTPQMLAEKRRQQRSAQVALPSSSTDVIEGFVVLSTPVLRKKYPPPQLPQGFTPHHQIRQSRFSASKLPDVKVPTPRLSASERAVLVNETKPPPLQAPQNEEKAEPVKTVATSGGFRPFAGDPDKQQRYEAFLTFSKAEQSEKLNWLQPLMMTDWERERERREFEQAARLFRPLSAAFSDRFVSASQSDDATDPLVPVARTSTADEDLKNAAKLKMYGHLTRKITEWEPHSILCKRFNIPQPGRTNTSTMKAKTSRPKFSIFNFLEAAPFNFPSSSNTVISSTDCDKPSISSLSDGSTIFSQGTSSRTDVDAASGDVPTNFNLANKPSMSENKVTPTVNVATTPSDSSTIMDVVEESKVEAVASKEDKVEQLADATNKMDLYKAIFLSSSEESEEEDDSTTRENLSEPTASQLNVLRNTSPPRGIFANLNFDALKSQEKKLPTSTEDKIVPERNTQRNSSPPRGIFANLNFDALNAHKNPSTVPEENLRSETIGNRKNSPPRGIFSNINVDLLKKQEQTTKSNSKEEKNISETDLNKKEEVSCTDPKEIGIYGPALPKSTGAYQREKIPKSFNKHESSDSEDNWVEMNNSSESDSESQKHSSKKKHSKKSHRKAKKHKEKKHKHKKKRK